jgi:uncharacterized protein (TIGR02118 family)
MIKICEVVHRRPGMSVADFQAHWLYNHGPIVAHLPAPCRYVQCHPRPGGYRNGDLICDGIAELWLDSKEALIAASQSPEFQAAKQDETNFVDHSRLVELLTSETVIKEGSLPSDGVKVISLLKFKAGMAPEAAHTYWRDIHGPIAAGIEPVRRYVQCPLRPGAYRKPESPAFDGLAMTWMDDMAGAKLSAESPAYHLTKADEANFLIRGTQAASSRRKT